MSRVGRKLYMFGGYDGDKCFNDVDILDLDTMTWISPTVSGNIPMARNAHTMTVLGTKLYLFGGHSGNKHLKDLHIFDTETLTWTEPQIFGSSPKGLRGHTANLIGNKIYLFGGYDGRGRSFKKIIPSNDLYVLNTDTMRWSHPVESEKAPAGR
jgi:N-acetylneuraminic acid mutarotase